VAVGALLAVAFVLISSRLGPSVTGRRLDAFGNLLLVVAGLSVALCRHRPRTAVGVVTVVLGCYVGRHYQNGPVWATGWIVLLALSWRTNRRTAVLGSAAMLTVLTAVALSAASHWIVPLVFLGWSVAAVLLGDALRNHRQYVVGLAERAQYLERTRDQESRRQVAEERLRIARDLHDSVAHAIATINVQAGAAAHVLDRRPEAAKTALAAIQRASGDVLDELTAMLTLLRDDGSRADRSPTPGIEEIERLVAATRGSGLRVSYVHEGPTHLVPAPVGTAAHRIVQESLTNVIRHANATTAVVTVRAGADRGLTVEVRDDGTGATAPVAGAGVGVIGMRERAASTGGRVTVGPADHGGFLVRASWDPRP
jgi:signal transduction histidine kinase